MFKSFTRRHSLDKPNYELKYQYIPSGFRFDIYKMAIRDCESTIQAYCLYRNTAISVNKEYFSVCSHDEINEYYTSDFFIDLIMTLEWHEVLSAIESFVHEGILFADEVNNLFNYYNIGYEVDCETFSRKYKVVIKYEELIKDNNKALDLDIEYDSVKESIANARKYLIDPNNIDIGNSIKSSVSAIEAYLRGMLENKKVSTLGDCIKELKKMKRYSLNIISSLEQLYIYRSSGKNIGHGSPEDGDHTVEDALLCNEMAISFINYFYKTNKD